MSGRRAVLLAGASFSVFTHFSLAAPFRHARRRALPVGQAQPEMTFSAETPLGPIDVQSRWAIITDYNTGAVLLALNADQEMPPSSLTKLMTAYVVFGLLKSGRLRLDETLPVSEQAWRMQGSKMFVPLGQQVRVDDLIRGMIIQSGNDACIVLAEGVAGSESQFVALMNAQARRLGMTHTEFRNATGWPDPEHHMSVRDIATLAAALIHDFPEYYHFFGEKNYSFDSIDQGNRNVLVDKGLADGLKTGHTDAGGFGLCASSERDGRRIILVLNGMPSSRVRSEEGERLLSWAFSNFDDVRLYQAAQTIETAPVWLGTSPSVGLISSRDVVITMPHGWQHSAKVVVMFASPLPAPIRKGEVVGQLQVSGPGIAPSTTELVAATNVGRMLLPLRSLAVLEHAVVGG